MNFDDVLKQEEYLFEEATLAAGSSEPAGSAPWAGKLRHARGLCDDWGCIRDEDGTLIIRVNLPTYDEAVLNEHRRHKTDPTQERVDFILEKLNPPNAPAQFPKVS